MAIVKMKKFNLFTFESLKEALLEELQKFEGVQFTNIQLQKENNYHYLKADSEDKSISEFEDEKAKVKFSIDFISLHLKKDKGLKALTKEKQSCKIHDLGKIVESSNWQNTYNRLKSLEDQINNIKNEITSINGELNNLSPWKNFNASFHDLKAIKTCKYLFGVIAKNSYDEFKNTLSNNYDRLYIEELYENKDGFNLFIIFHNSISIQLENELKNFGFSIVNLKYHENIGELINNYNNKLKELELEKENLELEIKKFASSVEKLKYIYDYYDFQLNKFTICNNFLKTEKVIAMEGWIPELNMDKFQDILNRLLDKSYYVEFSDAKEDDNVPILLKNNKFVEPFELITAMYSLPSYTEVDPTPILAPFFFIFFGMMLSDFGYGLVIFIASLLALKLLPLEKVAKKFMRLFFSISISTMFWGIIYGSYFGDAPTLFSPKGITPLWIDPSLQPMSVLLIAGIMGIIHIYTGLGIKAYILIKSNHVLDALFDTGFWYFTITGAILILSGTAIGISILASIGKYLAIIGAVGLVATQGRSNKSIVGKIAGGLFGLYGITGYMGDILSYSRLLALGLATGLIGSSFNLMIKLLGNGIAAWVIGIIIFLCGHIFNLAINALGAYVHACRLQYLEFFGKFYSGGGIAFSPYKSNNKYINIIKE
ncbi:MAG: V-type synthase subunit [Clostridiaceae bacterium]|jgi:V/A-type H+-transporting ATPase subunit I|nr:V-type synthase subunit [Clostridiaceae bacterium]